MLCMDHTWHNHHNIRIPTRKSSFVAAGTHAPSLPHTNTTMGGLMKAMQKPGDWRVDVKFMEKGVLKANASGVLLVPPEDALAFVTDSAGDSLFRVVQRIPLPAAPDGSQRVEVVNKAAIRVLAWKIWTSNRVVYQIAPRAAAPEQATASCSAQQQSSSHSCRCCACISPDSSIYTTSSSTNNAHEGRHVSFKLLSSNMLHSLTGTWTLEPVKIHQSALPTSFFKPNNSSSNGNRRSDLLPGAAATVIGQHLSHQSLSLLAGSSSSSSSSSRLSPGLSVDSDGNVTATLVKYEQHAQPKGMPPGVRFVPGMSDAVRMSIGREVRQMLDKIHHVALLEVHHGLTPQDALTEVAQQLQQAGGSFKKLRKQLLGDIACPEATAAGGDGVGSRGISVNNAAGQDCSTQKQQLDAHPLLNVQPLVA